MHHAYAYAPGRCATHAFSRLTLPYPVQLREARDILQETNAGVVAGVRSALRRARQVCCYGPGREGLVLKAFATRMHQMSISVSPPSIPRHS